MLHIVYRQDVSSFVDFPRVSPPQKKNMREILKAAAHDVTHAAILISEAQFVYVITAVPYFSHNIK